MVGLVGKEVTISTQAEVEAYAAGRPSILKFLAGKIPFKMLFISEAQAQGVAKDLVEKLSSEPSN
jgi:hypothetical protein